MEDIEGKAEGKTPKMVYETMHVIKSHQKRQDWMPVDRPRDRKQCENVKYAASQKKKLTNDEFFSSVELAIQTDNFVRQFTVYPDLVVHLASDNVLTLTKDLIKQSRTNSSLKQLVSYDTTFLLGDFYVSILVARNTCLVDDPIFPVAFLIHTKKYKKYHKAFLADIFEETGLASSKNIPIITDREKGITDCLQTNFPTLTNIYCTNHIIGDIKQWLQSSGTKDDIKVLKDDIRRLIQCHTKEDFHSTYKVLSSTWSLPFVEYAKKHLYNDLIAHCCYFVTCKFAAFPKGLVVTNNISESMNHVIKCVSDHKQMPLDCIIMIFKQMQDMFYYEFLRAQTKFGNFQLKKEFENCFKPREKVELSPIMSMEQIVENIMSKEHPVVRGVEKGPHFRLTQLAIARLCINKSLIGFTAATASFSVVNPFTGNVQSVKYFPKPSKCSCPSSGRCFHILAVNMALGEDKSSLKCKEKYSLSMLFKKKRGKGKKSGLKRPRPNDFDYDVNPAPDAPSPLDRKLLQNPRATSTPKRNNNFHGMPTMHVDHRSTFCVKARKHENMETSIQEKGKKDEHAIFPWEQKKEISIESCDLKRELENKLFCLSDTNWLTDEVVENAIRCILSTATTNETFLLWDTFFMTYAAKDFYDRIAAYACNNEALNFDNLVFIVNPGAHWYMVIVNIKSKKIFSVDSLSSVSHRSLKTYFERIFRIVKATYAVASLSTNVDEWTFICCSDVPQQQNQYDCGVHVITNMYCLANNLALPTMLPSHKARNWVKSLISRSDIDILPTSTKSRDKIQLAKIAVGAVWFEEISEIHIVKQSISEWYQLQNTEYCSQKWTVCDAVNCPGNKLTVKQLLCTSCRKWYHSSCIPKKGSLSATYYCCTKSTL